MSKSSKKSTKQQPQPLTGFEEIDPRILRRCQLAAALEQNNINDWLNEAVRATLEHAAGEKLSEILG